MNNGKQIVLIAHNIRSTHNVGSLLRTAEGLGVEKMFLTGYTPYPPMENDSRLPHLAAKLGKQISKTALGAESFLPWQYSPDIFEILEQLKNQGYTLAAIEQAPGSVELQAYQPPAKIAIIVGREVEGIEQEVLDKADTVLEIPMFGRKESFNVVQAAAMALYHCRFIN